MAVTIAFAAGAAANDLALGAADLAAAACELTMPQGKGSCHMPQVHGQCCTMMQAGVDHNKGAMMKALNGMKGAGGKDRVNTCMKHIKGDMGNCMKPADTEELPDFLALEAAVSADLAAAACELSLPGKGSCEMPQVFGQCCTMMQAGIAHNKGAMMKAFKGMKGAGGKARVNTCMAHIKGDTALMAKNPAEYCTKSSDMAEFPDFLALGASATESLMEAQEYTEAQDDASEDGESQIVTGLMGFVAGAAVTGLGVTVLRRRTPSQDEYNEIVA